MTRRRLLAALSGLGALVLVGPRSAVAMVPEAGAGVVVAAADPIHALYADLLGRAATDLEVLGWSPMSVDEVRRAICDSAEFRERFRRLGEDSDGVPALV